MIKEKDTTYLERIPENKCKVYGVDSIHTKKSSGPYILSFAGQFFSVHSACVNVKWMSNVMFLTPLYNFCKFLPDHSLSIAF